uniref:Uncharacterized protein n=1 Tax=Moorena producens (strain JHB) TaxID=1454205 RepID=A0A1D9FXB0_MOOP1
MGRGCVRNLRPHLVSPVETPKTALPPQDRAASLVVVFLLVGEWVKASRPFKIIIKNKEWMTTGSKRVAYNIYL